MFIYVCRCTYKINSVTRSREIVLSKSSESTPDCEMQYTVVGMSVGAAVSG